MHVILETPRLVLRRFTNSDEDADLLLLLNTDPEVLKYIHEHALQSREQAKEILNTIILPQYENGLGRWAVHTKPNNEFIGWCGLKFLSESNEIDLGYRFIKSEWGKGYATEAATYTLKYGFEKLYLKAIIGRAHIDNIASISVLEKIGMQFVNEALIDDFQVKLYIAVRPIPQ